MKDLKQLATEVIDLLGVETFDAARARAYDQAGFAPNGPMWVRVFRDALKAELRDVLQTAHGRPH